MTRFQPLLIKRINQLMTRKRLSPADLSKLVDIAPQHIRNILKGDRVPSLETIDRLEQHLGPILGIAGRPGQRHHLLDSFTQPFARSVGRPPKRPKKIVDTSADEEFERQLAEELGEEG